MDLYQAKGQYIKFSEVLSALMHRYMYMYMILTRLTRFNDLYLDYKLTGGAGGQPPVFLSLTGLYCCALMLGVMPPLAV